MTRKQVYAGIAIVLNSANVPGSPFTTSDIARAIRDVAVQISEDEWVESSVNGAQRWRRVAGSNKWFISTATTSTSEQRLVELHTFDGTASTISVYGPGGVVMNAGSPLDGWRCLTTSQTTDDVSTNAKAWAFVDSLIAAGLA
jgi:hypothetical protein